MTASDAAAVFIGLGFKQEGIERGDFMRRQDSGDAEPYIHWLSTTPCPRPELCREPRPFVTPPEVLAAKEADRLAAEANQREVAEMSRAAEIVSQAIKQVDTVTAAATEALRVKDLERDAARAERDEALRRLRELEGGPNAAKPSNPVLNALTFGKAGK